MNEIDKDISNELTTLNLCSGQNEPKSPYKPSSKFTKDIKSVIPKQRQTLLKWNGWGYQDSRFYLKKIDQIAFSGSRYPIGDQDLPFFTEWVQSIFNLNLEDIRKPQPMPESFPDPIIDQNFLNEIEQKQIDFSVKGEDRLIRAHGQALHDIHTLREGTFDRIPDLVLWPKCHDDVVFIVKLANERNVAVIPFGGGTSVSGSITCPQNEDRMIAIVDTSQMNKMLWLDRENMVACFESGIVGQDLERELRLLGLTVGHEPDSYEFSTLGGWVATRASGMKKNVYGNIEDLVVKVKMVTTKGVLERNCMAPRVSIGPDFNQIILGSEGTLGVITEVVLKVRPLPKVKQYGSLVFPDFEVGIKCMREIALNRCQPSSIRLIDNEQFRFGQALKPAGTLMSNFVDGIKKFYVTKIKGFDVYQIVVATIVYEGDEGDVKQQESKINAIAIKHGGFPAGATNGERGYVLTFVIAYIRDLALDYYIVAESFETSVPWDRCSLLCRNVKERVNQECKRFGVIHYLISCRVTQTYDAGCCVYFYFGFNYNNGRIKDPVSTYEDIESAARNEILACGGSLSHHHGVGKLRSKWYKSSISAVGVDLLKAAKSELDPKNIFAAGNLTHEGGGHSLTSKL